jgi:hypothetical protein
MDTYGKPCDGALLQAWEIVTQSNRITAAEFSAGIEFFINEGGKLPAPGDFRKWIQDRRDETTVDRQQAEDTARAKADDQARIEEWDSRHPEAESWTEADYRAYISGLMNEAIEAFTSKRKSRQGSDVGGPA